MNVALWIVQFRLGISFLIFGFMKAFQYEKAKAGQPWVQDTPKALVIFIGLIELLGGIGVVLPELLDIEPWLTPLSAIGLAVVMVLAAIIHAKRKEYKSIWINLVVLLLALFVAYGRWCLGI
jgi:uncharacterized membrane protein YphA (DoxX/SURF4 family)